ncbi:MAG TPA: PepSY domain-containing protein, partial [Burkholderiaceae bacterium]|nr:PepSY domain-containing protein [Burkholderiaceae bacterium]
MAAATVGVCVGCVAGISLTLAAAKWLPGRVDDMAAWHVGIYYAVFFACIAWALLRGPARAAVPLLWLG